MTYRHTGGQTDRKKGRNKGDTCIVGENNESKQNWFNE